MTKKIHYFDYAATTPLDPEVFRAMKPYFAEKFGNSSALYEMGRQAKKTINDSLEKIGLVLNCEPNEFIFTSSATEADNLAIIGTARAGKRYGEKIIISAVEHKGILSACDALRKEGFEICEIPVLKNGLINLNAFKKALNKRTILVSIVYADNETGTIQPISKIAKIIREFRIKNLEFGETKYPKSYTLNPMPYFHTDASQAAPYLNLNVKKLRVDLMTLSAHKIYGPKGIGGLYIKNGVQIKPIIFGGGQQNTVRSGTENVPGIVGFAEALVLTQRNKKQKATFIKKLRDKLERGIFKNIPKVILNGHPKKRLPNFLNVSILDTEGESLLLCSDEDGIQVGTGSACNSQSLEPSHILRALGRPYEHIHGSLRFTLGKHTKLSDINYVLKKLPPIVKKLRAISPLNLKIGQKKKIAEPKAFIGNQIPHFLKK